MKIPNFNITVPVAAIVRFWKWAKGGFYRADVPFTSPDNGAPDG